MKLPIITVLATLTALFAAQPAFADTAPNSSVFFYKSGVIITGTLANGAWHQTASLGASKHWDLAAASRTSLFLYNRSTGAVQTGTFASGTYTKTHTYTLATGFTLATASCDTLMLYRKSDNKVMTATLVNGVLGNRHTAPIFLTPHPFTMLAASCDTYALAYQLNNQSSHQTDYWMGTLQGGTLTGVGSGAFGPTRSAKLAMTDDSCIFYDGTSGQGVTGTAKAGTVDFTAFTTVTGFSHDWTKVVGTADSLLFYKSSTGVEATATLVNGHYSGGGAGGPFLTGWQIIVGGK
jgi:hypothetical protein